MRRNKVLSDNSSTNNSKIRNGSTKSHLRKKQFSHAPSAAALDKHALRTISNGSNTRDKSGSRRMKIHKNHNTIANEWVSGTEINQLGKKYKSNDPHFSRSKIPTKIPSINRQLANNTAYGKKGKKLADNSMNKNLTGIPLGRSNTQGKLKQNLFSPKEKVIKQGFESERSFADNLSQAKNEISILKEELKKKNNELFKLKKFRKIQDKCKTPQNQVGSDSPNKTSRGTKKRKIHSRLTAGTRRGPNKNLDTDRSNSQSDDYYETAKISPGSSYSNSIYSKGISQLKSSQS